VVGAATRLLLVLLMGVVGAAVKHMKASHTPALMLSVGAAFSVSQMPPSGQASISPHV
jgi:hypothetical protein